MPVPVLPPRLRRIVVIDNADPDPARSAGERAMVDLMHGLQRLGVDVRFHALGTGMTGAMLGAVLDDEPADAVIASRPGPAALALPALRDRPSVARIYWGHDVHARRLAAQASVRPSAPDMAERLSVITERECWRQYDVAVYPTQREADLVTAAVGGTGGASSAACPYYWLAREDLPECPPEPSRRTGILMVGGAFHVPNRDAVEWTASEILPLLLRDDPQAVVSVVGDWPADLVRALARPGLRFVGRVDDRRLRELHDGARCLLAPLRFGSGARRKVIAAMGLGLPVVTTSEGQEGVLVRDGHGRHDGLSVADSVDGIAAAVHELATDERSWSDHSAVAQDAVRRVYSPDAFDDAVRTVLRQAHRRRHP